jgi:hypothetical protein
MMTEQNKNLESIAGGAPAPEAPKQNQQNQQQKAPKVELTESEKIQLEIQKLQLENLKLEQLEKTLNLQDIQARVDERKMKAENVGQKAITNGQSLKDTFRNQTKAQDRCNHRKGGNGQAGYVGGQGDDPQYAVMKHTMCNGDVNIRCMRCGKTWKPPIADDFNEREDYLDAYADYKTALNFPTRNSPSGSVQFRYSDGGAFYREATRSTNLR